MFKDWLYDAQQIFIKLQFQSRRSFKDLMGAAQENLKVTTTSPSDYFLSLVPTPESNKMIATVNVFSMMILNRWASDLEKLSQIKAESILTPKHYKIVERSVCGENMRLEIEYECFNIQLSQELNKRSLAEKYLQESEMWYLAYCLAESAAAFHRLNKPIGDLRPQNILLNSSGKLKILSKWSVPTREDTFEDPQNKKCLYSPEELQMTKKGYKQYQLDYIVSESFSIGMTLLSAGAIYNLEQCYDYTKSELNMIEFNRMLTFWHQNEFYSELLHHSISYSKQLKDIVINLLELQPDRRLTSLQLYDLLKQHKQAIMAQQPFELQMSRVSSPKKKSLRNNEILREGIHVLRSRKKSQQKGSQMKNSVNLQRGQVSNFQSNLNMQLSFKQPRSFNGSHKHNIEDSSSPKRKKKLTTALYLSKQEGEQFK